MLEKVLFGRFLISSVSQQNCGMYENIFCFDSQYQGIWLKVPPLSDFRQKRRGEGYFSQNYFFIKDYLNKNNFPALRAGFKRRDTFKEGYFLVINPDHICESTLWILAIPLTLIYNSFLYVWETKYKHIEFHLHKNILQKIVNIYKN